SESSSNLQRRCGRRSQSSRDRRSPRRRGFRVESRPIRSTSHGSGSILPASAAAARDRRRERDPAATTRSGVSSEQCAEEPGEADHCSREMREVLGKIHELETERKDYEKQQATHEKRPIDGVLARPWPLLA